GFWKSRVWSCRYCRFVSWHYQGLRCYQFGCIMQRHCWLLYKQTVQKHYWHPIVILLLKHLKYIYSCSSFSVLAESLSVGFSAPSAPSTSNSSSSSCLSTLVTDAISSLSFKVINFTPWVARPITRKLSTPIRITIPDLLMIIKSFSSVTPLIATNSPVLSVTLMVFTPLPPRLVIL